MGVAALSNLGKLVARLAGCQQVNALRGLHADGGGGKLTTVVEVVDERELIGVRHEVVGVLVHRDGVLTGGGAGDGTAGLGEGLVVDGHRVATLREGVATRRGLGGVGDFIFAINAALCGSLVSKNHGHLSTHVGAPGVFGILGGDNERDDSVRGRETNRLLLRAVIATFIH